MLDNTKTDATPKLNSNPNQKKKKDLTNQHLGLLGIDIKQESLGIST